MGITAAAAVHVHINVHVYSTSTLKMYSAENLNGSSVQNTAQALTAAVQHKIQHTHFIKERFGNTHCTLHSGGQMQSAVQNTAQAL